MNSFNHEVRKSLGIIYDELRKNGKLIFHNKAYYSVYEERYAYKDDKDGMVYTVLYDIETRKCISISYRMATVSIDNSSIYQDAIIGGKF